MRSLPLYMYYCSSLGASLLIGVLPLLSFETTSCLIFVPLSPTSGLNKFVVLYRHLDDEVAHHCVQ